MLTGLQDCTAGQALDSHVLFSRCGAKCQGLYTSVTLHASLHTAALAMASTSEHEQATVPGFCDNCVKGHVFSGTPTGTEKKIGPYDTVYVARPTQVKQPTVAIVFFTDVFGLKVGSSFSNLMQRRPLTARSWSTINLLRTGSRNGQE